MRATHISTGPAGGGGRSAALTWAAWLVAGWRCLAHTLLEQAEALPETAEGGSRGSLQEKQVLVQGSEGA